MLSLTIPSSPDARIITAQKPSNDHPANESIIIPTDIPIEMSAKSAKVNRETDTYTLEGNVTVNQGNTRLRADKIVYRRRKR